MSDLGKVDREFFDRVIYPNLGAARDDVVIGPRHGVDFGAIAVGSDLLVVATDPLSIVPGLGWARAGRLALEVVLADVAVSGIGPTHVAVNLTFPPDLSDDDLEAIWRGFADHAEALDVNVVSGHTARYPGVEFSWVGGATALGVGDPGDLIRPDGARPGDALVISTGPAAEIAGLFATLFPDDLALDSADLDAARDRLDDIEVVADARAVADAGDVSAMHDATEGGVRGGLIEMARGAGARFDVDADAVPVGDGVRAVCESLGVDPWSVTSSGTLLIAVDPDDAGSVVDALAAIGTDAAVVGQVREGDGAYLDGERIEAPPSDPSWAAYDALDR